MKKLLLLLLILTPTLLVAESYNATLSFDLSPSHGNYFFDAGFTREDGNNITPSSIPEKTESIDINSLDDSFRDVSVYYIVKGSSSFLMKLYATGPLKMKDEDLEWSISWSSNTNGEKKIGEGLYGREKGDLLYKRESAESVIEAGYIPLVINLLPDSIQRAGVYTASLVLEIESLS